MLKMTTWIALGAVLLIPSGAAAATPQAVPMGAIASGPQCMMAASEQLIIVAGASKVTPMNARTQTIDMNDDDQGYDASYLFGMTKGVAGSTMTPAVKPLVFLFTVPLDLVLLPFAAIGGFF
jgi:hypothetical protein